MSLQNRVDPLGNLVANKSRGGLMGNRGQLHNSQKKIVRETQRPAWIFCALQFNDRQRTVMSPDSYTELFFLDECTALSAGHRPCGTCQRERYKAFVEAFNKGNSLNYNISQIDRTLRAETRGSGVFNALRTEDISALPDGTMVLYKEEPWLLYRGVSKPSKNSGEVTLYRWSFSGYTEMAKASFMIVEVITPPSVVAAFKGGYLPKVHPSIFKLNPKLVAEDISQPIRQKSNKPSLPKKKEPVAVPPKKTPESVFESHSSNDAIKYKLAQTPRGRDLWTYMAAILEVTEMIEGNPYPLKRIFSNFKGHQDTGRIIKDGPEWRLSEQGIDYFKDRFEPSSRQQVFRDEVDRMKHSLRNGGKGWVPF